MSHPQVSVVIPVYNCEQYLGEAIASVLDQSGSSLELIVADDGSTDGTARVARSFGERVQYLHFQHRGQAATLNSGIERARGELLAFLDSDDRWPANTLSLRMAALARDLSLDMVFGLSLIHI